LTFGPGDETPEPVLVDDKHQVTHVHVRNHALRLYRDHRRPGPGKEIEEKGDTPNDRDDPEDVPGKRDTGVIAIAERPHGICCTLQPVCSRHLL